MRVCIVGGIFDKPESYRARHVHTPETILAEGLAAAGVDVATSGHADFEPSDDFDVVHVHHIGRAAYRMATAGTRSVFIFTGHDGRMMCGDERSRVRRAAFRHVVRSADALVALSHAEANFLQRLAGGGKPVSVISNGIPPAVYRRPDIAAWHRQMPDELLYVGQLTPFKGTDTLFQAIQQLRRTHPVRLRLAFQNVAAEPAYRALVEQLGIGDIVHFDGFLPPDKLAELYSRASLLVHPTRADSLPSVITEAFLCGTPVVASGVGGIPEQVHDYGVLVQPGDVEELTEALAYVLDHLETYRARAGELREYAQRRFDVQAMIDRHLHLYQRLLRTLPHSQRSGMQRIAATLLQPAIRLYWSTIRRPSRAALRGLPQDTPAD